jgi:hypothetical protein
VRATTRSCSAASSVSIRHEGETDVISLTQGDPVAAIVVVMDALGICEANFVNWYLSQIIDVAKPGARADEKATNAMLAGKGNRNALKHGGFTAEVLALKARKDPGP